MAMTRRDDGARRFLESWEPPPGASEPIGCIATTFTFDPDFFEEQCLTRFLRLESDPREDGAAYLIEREEKLATLTVSVLVDRSTARGSQSPRWDVLPVTLPGGIQHAKIAVLSWHNWIRVLVGSANLTVPAYRKNQEIFGILDFREGGQLPIETLSETLRFLRAMTTFAPGSEGTPGPKARLLDLLGRLVNMSSRWPASRSRPKIPTRGIPIFLGPMPEFRQPVLERLGRLMRDQGGPATGATVVSPFFDPTPGPAYPGTTALLAAMTDRGHRSVRFLVGGESLPDGRIRLRAPRTILRSARKMASFEICPVSEDAEGEYRPLHAKSVWLWSDWWHVYMVGSSNFTAAGLGLPHASPNLEAGLAYVFPEDGGLVRAMEQTLPPHGDRIQDLDRVLWEPIEEEQAEGTAGVAILPRGFEEALFTPDHRGGTLQFHFREPLPPEWVVTLPGAHAAGQPGAAAERRNLDSFYSHRNWIEAGKPPKVAISWREPRVPTEVEVHWQAEDGHRLSARWPVNVTDMADLPPPEDLRNLPLDVLVDILGSRRLLHEAVAEAKGRHLERSGGAAEGPLGIDPHRKVRTETFLLQRTRRVAKAIEYLVERLNRPAAHRAALAWRLRGPVGPLALARAIKEAARSPAEACFLLSDLGLALRWVKVDQVALGVPGEEVRGELQTVLDEIEAMTRAELQTDGGVPKALRAYVLEAFAEARR